VKLLVQCLALTVLALMSGCAGTKADIGLTSWLRVAGGQFFAGDVETGAGGGPAVVSVLNSLTRVQPGEREKPLSGALEASAAAVVLGLRGDRGYWVVVPGPPALDAPELPTFAASLSFSLDLPLGPLALIVRAVDSAARSGTPTLVPLTAVAPPEATGALVVRLGWDTEADLDLHVVVPGGIEVWARNINSYSPPPPGTPQDASAWEQGGILDFDSNAGCVIDGRRQENVIWSQPPPAGTYLVRVDSASLCGATAARWTVEVFENGIRLAASQGESVPSDGRFSKGSGSGVQALTFDVPPP
jgi:hypothetical protein